MQDYPKSQWLFELINIISKRELIEKKDAMWQVVEDIEEVDNMFDEGMSPQEAYKEMTE